MDSTKYWVALSQAHGVGMGHLKEVHDSLRQIGISLSDIFDLTPKELEWEFSFKQKTREAFVEAGKNFSEVEEEYNKLLDAGIEVIPFFSEFYVPCLYERMGSAAPPILYSYGNRDILKMQLAAILGDSGVSARGESLANMAAKELSKHNIVTVSGMAKGVGLAAHRSALESGGKTLAVIPSGMFHLSIPETLQMVYDPEKMLIISQFKPGREGDKYSAMSRNGLISAMSGAVYIVEAPNEGGVFEAAKSCRKYGSPLYTTEYSEYPNSALGNAKIISEYGGIPVRGRKIDDLLMPNMDKFIGDVKFK